MQNNSTIKKSIYYFFVLLAFISFWVFSRFTVDDAFISWRYGKNLVETGIWNYNPTTMDMTQAYTNPIFAFISIIPNYLGIDIVLFFKILSLINLIVFLGYISKKIKNRILIACFFALPATMIHLFSGLETFLYVSLMVSLFINFYEDKPRNAILISLALFLVRPETWLFVVLTPAYFLIKDLDYNLSSIKGFLKSIELKKLNFSLFFKSVLILSIPLGIYFILHKMHFGYYLPNTFYIKSGQIRFKPIILIKFVILASPLLILLLKKKYSLFIIMFAFFSALIFNYSMSDLKMNYAFRFGYHIFAPIFFIWLYSVEKGHLFKNTFLNSNTQNIIKIIPFGFLLFFAIQTNGEYLLANDYPRSFTSHSLIGKTLYKLKDKVKSFSFGDAGMTAYHSEINALDNIGLGSAKIAHSKGVTNDILNLYNPDVVILHANNKGIRMKDHSQKLIYDWAQQRGFKHKYNFYAHHNYVVTTLTKEPFEALMKASSHSAEFKDISTMDYFFNNIKKPPFYYWHE